MAAPKILTRMFGTAISTTAGFAAGTALGPVLGPVVRLYENDVNSQFPYVPPDPETLAAGVAEGKVEHTQAAEWAKMNGIGDNAFAALLAIAYSGPELGYAFRAWRRGTLTDDDFYTALRRAGLEEHWFPSLAELKGERLDLGAIATAVHRGIMVDAGLLVTGVPSGSGKVPRIPVSTLDTLAEFAAHGIDKERARVLVADTGLPLSLGEMLSLYNRGKVTETDVKVSIAESNVRNEYMDVALALAQLLLTPHEQAEAELRGVKTRAEAEAGAKLRGLEPDDYATLFEIMGRPLNVHEVTTALARGGKFGGTYDDVPEPYRDAIRRSAIRPEYAGLAFANRFLYPSAFVLRSLAEAGDLGNEAGIAQTLSEIAWPPSLIAKVAPAWHTAGGGSVDPHVKKAQTTLFTEAHKAYVKNGISVAQVTPAFTALNIPADAQSEIVALWDVERTLAADVPPAA